MTNENNYLYDVFISYRWVEPDKSWVRNQLKPALEMAGLEVFLDVEDFVPGRDLVREMTRASTESRRGLCILSPDYFKDAGRPVNFESLMLRSLDFSGDSSRLIPFILRESELPLYIKNLIPIDWTDAAYHQREWTKLLNLLEAKNREVPPPAPLQPGVNPPQPVPPVPIPRPRPWIPKLVWVILGAVLLLGLLAFGYKTCRVKTIEGRVFYKQAPGDTALIAVPDVEVYLANTELHSKPTGPDGKFSLRVPLAASIELKAKYGNLFYEMSNQKSGNYPVIPRDVEPSRNFINTSWSDAPQEPCVPDDGRERVNMKVFKIDVGFTFPSGKDEAYLTTELIDAPEIVIIAADVVDTPPDSYRDETREKEDTMKSRTWRFTLSKSGSRTHLIVCLGSDRRDVEIMSSKLKTYYTLP